MIPPGTGMGHRLNVEIDGSVGIIRLNRPTVLNAIDNIMASELETAVCSLTTRVAAVVLCSNGPNFCVGADLRYLRSICDDRSLLSAFISQISGAFAAISRISLPVICAVRGYALAGGFELMQVCDIVIVAEDCVIGDHHANYGLIPGAGGTQRLCRIVGRQRALSLLLTGDRLSGREACAWGLAYKAVADDSVDREALRLAHSLASKSAAGLAEMKALVNDCAGLPTEEALQREVDANVEHGQHPDFREGLAAFEDRRRPTFMNRRSDQ